MGQSGMIALISVLLIAVVGLGLYIYREETRPGVEVQLGNSRLSIEQR